MEKRIDRIILAGSTHQYEFYTNDTVYNVGGVAPALKAHIALSQGHCVFVKEENTEKLRIRKLTEGECLRLMGFQEADTKACKAIGHSRYQIAHEAGDSIVATVLMGVFGELLGIDYQSKIDEHTEKLREEVA